MRVLIERCFFFFVLVPDLQIFRKTPPSISASKFFRSSEGISLLVLIFDHGYPHTYMHPWRTVQRHSVQNQTSTITKL